MKNALTQRTNTTKKRMFRTAPTSGVQVPDEFPPKKIFFIRIGHPMRIKKIFAPKSPILSGFFTSQRHVRERTKT